jgi:uncharacterized membrane protein YedE/YeeE
MMNDFQVLTVVALGLMLGLPPFALIMDRRQGADIRPLPPKVERLLLVLKIVVGEFLFGIFFAIGVVGLVAGYTTFGSAATAARGGSNPPAWWVPIALAIGALVTLIPMTVIELSRYVRRDKRPSGPTDEPR